MSQLNLSNQTIESPIEFVNDEDDVVATFTSDGLRKVGEGVYEDTQDYVTSTMDLKEKTIEVVHEDSPDSPSVFTMGISDKLFKDLQAWAEKITTPPPKTGGNESLGDAQ
jgi:hypothetical protein